MPIAKIRYTPLAAILACAIISQLATAQSGPPVTPEIVAVPVSALASKIRELRLPAIVVMRAPAPLIVIPFASAIGPRATPLLS